MTLNDVAAGRPDVLIVYTDQWRWDAIGVLGSPVQTPVVDRLAADGIHFDHAFVQSPVCMPSRVSMLTGRYPSDLGITHMGVPVPEDTETIATVVRRRGYRTANIGKLHFLPHANRDHAAPHPSYGFDVLALSDEPGPYEDDYRAWVRSVDPEAAARLSTGLPPAAQVWRETMGLDDDIAHPPGGAREDFDGAHEFGAAASLTHTAWVAARTIEHLESLADDQPAFTIASFFSPHAPFNVPREYLDLYDPATLPLPELSDEERAAQPASGVTDERIRSVRQGYFAAISEIDHHVGRILETLERLDRADRTVVVVVSDHGEWLGDHLRFSKGYPADDPVSRVPLVVRWPRGLVEPGRRVSTIVEAVDVMPTVLDALGIPIPPSVQGRSLFSALLGGELDRIELAVTEHHGWRSVRTPTHRYVVHADGSERLFDLGESPLSEVDVVDAPEHQAALAEIRRLVLQRVLEVERPLPRTWPY
ncbi:MAG: sulfatase [Cellulomonas sp.]